MGLSFSSVYSRRQRAKLLYHLSWLDLVSARIRADAVFHSWLASHI